MEKLIRYAGSLDDWNVYRKMAVVCDVTEFFIRHHMPVCRTVDQMRQAARSGKQNLVEGMADSTASFEICFKLLGIARGSLRELREDYKDFLRQNKLLIWDLNDTRTVAWRKYAGTGAVDVAAFTSLCERKSPQTIANVMITLTSQLDTALFKLMEQLKTEFALNGGIKEKLSQIRRSWRMAHAGY